MKNQQLKQFTTSFLMTYIFVCEKDIYKTECYNIFTDLVCNYLSRKVKKL